MKRYLPALMVMAIICISTVVPTEAMAQDDNIVVQQSDQFRPVSLYMKEGRKLSAEPAPETEDKDHVVTCPDGYVGDGLFGYGIIKRVGHVYWERVGKWETESLGSAVTLQAPIKYVIYVSSKSYTTGDFAFNMLINGKYVNSNRDPNNWTIANNVPIDDTPTRIEVEEKKINLSATPINGGDTFGIEIWCRLQGDVKLHYGSHKYPSALVVNANSIAMREVKAERKKVTFVYSDSFNVPLASMKVVMTVDDNEYQVEPQAAYEKGYPAIVWNLPEELDPGPHVVRVSLAYDMHNNNTFYFEQEVTVKAPPVTLTIPGWVSTVVIIVVLAIAAYGLYTWYENKKLEEFLLEEGYEDYLTEGGS